MSSSQQDSRDGATRRSIVKALGAASLAAAAPAWLGAQSPAAARPFDLRDVRLLDGPFRDAQRRDGDYMLSLDPDRMLHNFRVNAGLEPKAPVYGGWESQQPWVDIRCHGHTLGHWLSAGSLMYASTGNSRFKERVDYLVDELKACQDAAGSGLVCAFPDNDESLLGAVAGREYPGVPWYTMHKIFAGLRDASTLAGNQRALEVLVQPHRLGLEVDGAALRGRVPANAGSRTRRHERSARRRSALTGDDGALKLARRFCHRALLDPLVRGVDPLDGLHGNTQIPKVVGFARIYELTGEPDYLAAARFFWDRVANHRSFVTGGHGDVEHFFPPAEFSKHLDSAKTNETCGSHNMLRLTRMLQAQAPDDARYGDFYERTIYNAILASQDPQSGWNTYFQAVRPGYLKLYHTPEDSFWCCTGTGMENHAKYGDSIYFRGVNDLYVNLFIPSELSWAEKRVQVRQTTRFPDSDVTRLEIESVDPVRFTLRLRSPSWSDGATVTVNGEPVEAHATSGGSIALDREWRSGDHVEVRFSMSVRGVELPGEPNRVAFLHGPVVLAGRLGTAGLYPGADILRNERTSGQILNTPVEVPELPGPVASAAAAIRRVDGGQALAFKTSGIGQTGDVELIPYFRLHHERYNLYWRIRES